MANHACPAMAPHVRAAIHATAQPKAELEGTTADQRPLAPHVQAAIAATAQPRLAGSGGGAAQAHGAVQRFMPRPSNPSLVGLRNGAQTIQRYLGHEHYTGKYVNRGPNLHSHDSKLFSWDVPEFVADLPYSHMKIEFHELFYRHYRLEISLYNGSPSHPPQLLRYVALRDPFKAAPLLRYVRSGYASLDVTGNGYDDLRIFADAAADGSGRFTLRVEGMFESVEGISESPPEGRFVFRNPEHDEPSGLGRGRLVEFDVSEIIPENGHSGRWPSWKRIRAQFIDRNGSIQAWVFLHNGKTSLGTGAVLRPGRIKGLPRLNYVKKGLAAIDLMDGDFGEVRILVAPVGVSPDTSLTLRVQGREVFSTTVDPVTNSEVASMWIDDKAIMALQYAEEAVERHPESPKPLGDLKSQDDFFRNPGELLRYIKEMVKEHVLRETPEKKIVRVLESVKNFSDACFWAKDVEALRRAGTALATNGLEFVRSFLPK